MSCRPPPRRAVSAWLEMPFVRIAKSPAALPLVTKTRGSEAALLKGDLLRRWATYLLTALDRHGRKMVNSQQKMVWEETPGSAFYYLHFYELKAR